MTHVHLHARRGEGGPGCRTICGLPCGSRETTAYLDLDPERVTCPTCLPAISPRCQQFSRAGLRGQS